MKKKIAALLMIFGSISAYAQNQWKPPTTVRAYCFDLESSMMNTNRTMYEINTKALNTEDQAKRVDLLNQGAAFEKSLYNKQSEWQRLSCTQLLYSK